jgi:hypothetical protein
MSLDLQPSWKEYVTSHGYGFRQWDLNDGGLVDRCGWATGAKGAAPADTFAIISYVLIYCTDDKTARMLRKLLHEDGVRAVLVAERGQENNMIPIMRRNGVGVELLMRQEVQRDDRQMLFLGPHSPKIAPQAPPGTEPHLTFPNVPFEEHKGKSR